MISDEDIKRLFQNGKAILAKNINDNQPLPTQFHRGVKLHVWEGQHPGGCERHLSIFNQFNIIPKYCFNCYKVYFEPRTVVELFKLMVVFEKLKLPNDNTRKCIVETREQISGSYKGFIYCRGLKEGKKILKIVQKIVREEISKHIPISLKRGCSEYALSYPEYAKIEKGGAPIKYIEKWQECEDLHDKDNSINKKSPESDTYNSPGYTLFDAKIMLAWLKYAATIGDLSYVKISGVKLQPFVGLNRPRIN